MNIEVHEQGRGPRRIEIDRPYELGRTAEIAIDDAEVSRTHLRLSPGEDHLVVEDLGSANGTTVDGVRITGQVVVGPGSVIVVGGTEIVVEPDAADPAEVEARRVATRSAAGPGLDGTLSRLASRANDAGSVRFRPGSAGEKVAGLVLGSLKKVRKRMAGLGSEPLGILPEVMLMDPVPDPDAPGQMLTTGTLLDRGNDRIWMIVTPESPPEPIGRPLALLFGSALPAAEDLQIVLEGYGLYLTDLPDPDPQLRDVALPTLLGATGELRAAMALSFVRFLLDRGGEGVLTKLLNAPARRVDNTAQDLYGDTLGSLEEAWRLKLAGGPAVKNAQFLRLSVKYLRPQARRQAEIAFYMILGLGFNVVFPFVTKRLFDHALPSGQFSQVLRLLGFLGGAFLISMLAGLRQTQLSAHVSGSVVKQLRVEMFDKLQSLPTGWFAARDQSDVLSRMFGDVAVVESGLSQALREGVFQILTLVVEGVVLLRLNLLLGALVLVSAPMVAVIYRGMGAGAQKRSLAVQERSNGLIGVTAENYLAQPVVKAFGLQGRERERFSASSDRLFRDQIRLALFGGLFGLSVSAVVTLLRLAVLALGAYLILHGHLSVGGLVAFLGVMGDVISPVTALTTMGQALQQCTGALVRVNEILNAVSTVVDEPGAPALNPMARDIQLVDVSFAYTPDRLTLDRLSLTIEAGSRVAFVGPSGAGKSSVLGLLQRNYDPDDGVVMFDGVDISTVELGSLRQQISVVFQDTFLFDTTIRENIALGRDGATDDEIAAAAEQAGVAEFAASLPRGLDTLVGERGGRLSGGQRQRVAIARALVRNPQVLILDEATSALDPRTERQIAATLEELSHGRTTVAVTHRLTSVTDYDRIFVINAGMLVESGTHDQLLALGGLYASLWAEQTGGPPPTPKFDPAAYLSSVPIFAGLERPELEEVAGRMLEASLALGRQIPEGRDGLVLVVSGHGMVEAPTPDGRRAQVVELGPGDCFGVGALLGRESGLTLKALENMRVLLLDHERITALAATNPTINANLTGTAQAEVALPRGTQHLARVQIGTGADDGGQPQPPPPAGPGAGIAGEVPAARTTRSFIIPGR